MSSSDSDEEIFPAKQIQKRNKRSSVNINCISSRHLRRRIQQEVSSVISHYNLETNNVNLNNSTEPSPSTISYSNNNNRIVEELDISVPNEDKSIDSEESECRYRGRDYREDLNAQYSENSNSYKHSTENNFFDSIAIWSVKERIPLKSVSKLLKILKKHKCHKNLPSDARTLLQTPRSTIVKVVEPGVYHHFGLMKGLIQFLNLNIDFVLRETEIKICINVDGLPLSKSSNSQLWPILGSVYKTNYVFVVGVFYSNVSKPENLEGYLEHFVQESIQLIENGIYFEKYFLSCLIYLIVVDAPAKSFILNVKGHSGYSSCSKCKIEGEYINNRVCFPEIENILRTDTDFIHHLDEAYHLGPSPLEHIPNLGLVSQVPLDYMHLVCLGIVKKLFVLWTSDSLQVRLQYRKLQYISNRLLKFVGIFVPLEFQRQPRSLSVFKQWKATEFRQFLLYSGPVVLKGIVSDEVYLNFLTLHLAISILSSQSLHLKYNEYADSLLKHFVLSFKNIYGVHHLSHNIHGLLHLASDVKLHGPLDLFSAFKFENHMQQLKKMVRKSDKPLQQISRRCIEFDNIALCDIKTFKKSTNYDVSLKNDCFVFKGFTIIAKNKKNNCCQLKTGEIILVDSFSYDNNKKTIVNLFGRQFLSVKNLYKLPCPSSLIDVHLVKEMSPPKLWPINLLEKKLFLFKVPWDSDSYVVFPLIHLNI